MRLSCCAYSYRQALQSGAMSLPDLLRLCREIGFDGVELTAYYFPTTERAFLEDLKRQAQQIGLAISGAAVGSDFAQPDDEKRCEAVAMVKEWIGHSVTLGAPTLRVFAGAVREGQSESDAFDAVVESLQECAEFAEERGVTLALENHGGLTATATDTIHLVEAIAHPALGINLDFGNFGGDIYRQFTACAPYAVAAHAKPHARGSRPGEMVPVDYERVRDILTEANYSGCLAIEYEEEEPAQTAVPRFFAALRSVFL